MSNNTPIDQQRQEFMSRFRKMTPEKRQDILAAALGFVLRMHEQQAKDDATCIELLTDVQLEGGAA